MIEHVELRNFKSARDLRIPLKPLTILSGMNGSGKSTVLQALGLVFQNSNLLTSILSELTMHLNGSLVKLGRLGNVLSERADDQPIQITVASKQATFRWSVKESAGAEDDSVPVLRTYSGPEDRMTEARAIVKHAQFLQADRLTPQTLYDRRISTGRDQNFLGAHGQFTPAYLAEYGETIVVREKRRCALERSGIPVELQKRLEGTNRLNSQISRWLQYLSPGVRLSAHQLAETDSVRLAFSYASTELAQDSSNRRPSHVGFGLTYCLPILTACLAAEPGDLLLLENPEAHLHPRGQVAMGLLLARCAADGVQILVETHSDHILNGIRLAVKHREADIDAATIQICHFKRDSASGDSYIESPMVLPNGELSAWPDGFFDDWEKSLEMLLE